MEDWVFDVGAIAACCIFFVILFSIMRVILMIVKVTALAAILFFAIKYITPDFSVSTFLNKQKLFSAALSGYEVAMGARDKLRSEAFPKSHQ